MQRSRDIVVVDALLGIVLVLALPLAAGMAVGRVLTILLERRPPAAAPPPKVSPERTPDDTPKAGGGAPARRPSPGRGPRGGRPPSGRRGSTRRRARSPSAIRQISAARGVRRCAPPGRERRHAATSRAPGLPTGRRACRAPGSAGRSRTPAGRH